MKFAFDLSARSIFKRIAVAYVLICLSMWGAQRQMLYLPSKNIHVPEKYGLTEFADVRIPTSDGLNVQAWYHKASEGFPTLLYFHGNGGNLSNRVHYYHDLKEAGFGLLALSYRGYGMSEGSPSEEGFYNDARAAIAYAKDTLSVKPEEMIFYGESIGTGVAVQMATEYASGALVLQSPYSSMVDLARYYYPWLPVTILLTDRFDSISKIARNRVPLLLFHGEKDEIVPLRFGKALFDAAPNPKEAVYMSASGHVNLDFPLQTKSLVAFGRKHQLITVAEPVQIIR